jgi:hypothetical protein
MMLWRLNVFARMIVLHDFEEYLCCLAFMVLLQFIDNNQLIITSLLACG